MTKSIKYVKGEPWQGKGREIDRGKELTAPCGCVFVCVGWNYRGRGYTLKKGQSKFDLFSAKKKYDHFHWFRTKDCPKLKAFIIQSVIDANLRSDKWGEETRRLIREGIKRDQSGTSK